MGERCEEASPQSVIGSPAVCSPLSTSALSFRDRILRALWRCLPKHALSRLLGAIWRIPLPRFVRGPVLSLFARTCAIDVGAAEKPLREYGSVHDFFVRRLQPGARPIPPEADAILCPADGRIVETGSATSGKMMSAKGMEFSLRELLADAEAARQLEGGPYAIVYLSPSDYHRVHAPIDGRVMAWLHVPGQLFSVAGANLRREPRLFARNERLVTLLDGDTVGPCACVMVAAFGVGDISASYDGEGDARHRHVADGAVLAKRFVSPPRVRKGDELGIFHLGSTVIVVFAPGQVELSPLPCGASVRVGQSIGRVLRGQPDIARASQS
jgi:phosphatidylserine decarboxylase